MLKKNGIYLFGASGHGKVVMEIAEELTIPVLGFVDANPEIQSVCGYEVARQLPDDGQALISIGNNKTRKNIASQYPGYDYVTLIHPKASISRRAQIGEGTVVMSSVSVNSGTVIGDHCILNTNASVDHECNLGDFVHISPNVALAGDVWIGEGTHIGIGACVIQGVRIGKWCTIGAGAVIIRDIPDFATVVGNPGRVI